AVLRVELDLLLIFLGFDFYKSTFDRLLDRVGEIVHRLDLASIHFGYGEVIKFVIAYGVICRKHLTQDNDAAVFTGKKLRLKTIEINEPRRRFTLPVRAPFFEILAGEFLKNEAPKHKIFRRFIERVRWKHVILCVAVLER